MQTFKIKYAHQDTPKMTCQVKIHARNYPEARNFFIHQMYEKGVPKIQYNICSINRIGVAPEVIKPSIARGSALAL